MILIQDGFDVYSDVNGTGYGVQGLWPGINGGFLDTGRFGGHCCALPNGNPGVQALPASQSTVTFGTAVKIGGGGANPGAFIGLNQGGSNQISLSIAAMQFQVRRGNFGGTVLGTDAVVRSVGTWYFVEWAVTIHGSAGTVDLWVDGAHVLSLTGLNTCQTGTTNVDAAYIGGNLNGNSVELDDLYIRTGLVPFGPCRIETLRPASDVAAVWTPNSGGNNFSRLNEDQIDADTTYVSSANPGDQDLYDVHVLSSSPTSIFAVQQRIAARKDDAGLREITATLKSSSTTEQSGNLTMASSYVWSGVIYETDPATSAAWIPAGVNAIQIGQKEVA